MLWNDSIVETTVNRGVEPRPASATVTRKRDRKEQHASSLMIKSIKIELSEKATSALLISWSIDHHGQLEDIMRSDQIKSGDVSVNLERLSALFHVRWLRPSAELGAMGFKQAKNGAVCFKCQPGLWPCCQLSSDCGSWQQSCVCSKHPVSCKTSLCPFSKAHPGGYFPLAGGQVSGFLWRDTLDCQGTGINT